MRTVVARACIVADLAVAAGLVVVVQAGLASVGHDRRREDSDEEHWDDGEELHIE